MLSRVPFAAYLAYSPRGTSEVSIASRTVRDHIKHGRNTTLEAAVTNLARDFATTGLASVLGPDVTLVPAPRSSPLITGAFWPAEWICNALVAHGLGASTLACLERAVAVPKSAFATPGNRPDATRHFETIRATQLPLGTARITIVDDFVTKGNTLLGASSALATVCGDIQITTFALIRTKGLQPEIQLIVDPCVGELTLQGREARRTP